MEKQGERAVSEGKLMITKFRVFLNLIFNLTLSSEIRC